MAAIKVFSAKPESKKQLHPEIGVWEPKALPIIEDIMQRRAATQARNRVSFHRGEYNYQPSQEYRDTYTEHRRNNYLKVKKK